MLTAAQAIAQAQSQVGVKESPPGSNCQLYGVWYGMPCADWCAIFASWAIYDHGADQTPIPITTPLGFAWCPDGVVWFRSRGAWFSTGGMGDLIFYDWNGDGVADHVEIVLLRSADGSTYTTLGGNTGPASANNGGEVAVQVRQANYCVMGFGRPNYAAATTPAQPVPAPVAAPVPPANAATDQGDEMLSFTDPKNGCKAACNALGEVYNFNADGTVGGHYLGGLNSHPEWHAGGGAANGPAVIFQPYDDGNPALSGYVIITQDGAGVFHPYAFPSNASLAN